MTAGLRPAPRAARARWDERGALFCLQAAVLVVTLLIVIVAAGWTAPAAAAAVSEADGELRVEVTGLDPPFLAPGRPLTVTGTLSNGTASTLSGARLDLRLQRTAPASRFALNAWLDPAAAYATTLLARQTVETPVPPGTSIPFSVTVPPEEVPLTDSASSWGPRGVLVEAVAADDGGPLTDSDRTLLVWQPERDAPPTMVTVVVPLAPTAADLLGAALAGVGVAEQGAERVAAVAAATAQSREVAWALDPALLTRFGPDTSEGDPATTPTPAEPEPGGTGTATAPQTPTPTPTPTQTPAGTDEDPAAGPPELADVLRTLGQGREIVALPYADADAAALVHGGQQALYDRATELGRRPLEEHGLFPLDGVAWPAAKEPDAATVGALAARGATTVVVPQSVLPLTRELTYTPTGRGTVLVADDADAEGREVDALLWEEALSAAVGGTAPRSGDKGEAAAALAARQYVLALTAIVALERPNDPRHILAVVPRSFDGDPSRLGDRLSALASAPWVTLAPLSALRAAEDPGLARASLPEEVVEDPEAPPGMLEDVVRARVALERFATIAADPEELVRDEQLRLLQVTSAAWRTDPGGRSSFANIARNAAAELPAQLAVVASGTVNLISETGELPVTVRNRLDQPVTALLRLTPEEPSLQVPDVIPVDVPAGSEVAFPVKVTAVGSADVEVHAELTDGMGRPVGEPATLFVRVRADWENVGTALVAAAVGVAFVLGLVRSIRRARRRSAGRVEVNV